MASAPSTSQLHNPPQPYPHTNDMAAHALIASTFQTLDQRAPPSMHEILAAFTSKGDGDREMLFALLNAKAAEDNRIAADRNLRRSLLEMYRTPHASSSAMYMPESPMYPFPSPPTSSYRESPHRSPRQNGRASRSPSHSSDEASYAESRKRRRSRSPDREYYARRQGSLSAVTRSDAPLPPSPYSSASSQSSGGSPRSRESMAIGSLLTASHERDTHAPSHRTEPQAVSYARREDDSGRRHS
ncbi:hypothetical protein BDW22DRAFT_1355200 [Trametopsis cervina]|nr:hypothetical protein BDW22DRAFT_1355200 [Trametopsis cervina]